MHRMMRAILPAIAALLALSVPAQAAEKRIWAFVTFDDRAQLYYGVPESHAITIAFVCVPKAKRIEIVSAVLPRKPRKGQAVTLTLRNGKASAAYAGTTRYEEDDGFSFAASTAAEPKFVDVLKSGAVLTIAVPGRQERVPLRAVAKPLKQFEAACFGG